jgi:two-component system cell cycle sensor histidine kinase/response regulator CckA
MLLVIDDEELIRESIQDILEMTGIETLCAADGRAGLELFKAQRTDIDAILLDLAMPVMNGPETLREIRELDPNIRIILSSGYPERETLSHISNDRSVIFLQKPYSIDTLITKVNEALQP